MRLKEIAKRLNGLVIGSKEKRVQRFLDLESADDQSLSFCSRRDYMDVARNSNAAALLTSFKELSETHDIIHVDDIKAAYVRCTEIFGRRTILQRRELLADNSKLRLVVGSGTVIHETAVLLGDVVIGSNCEIHPNVTIYPDSVIGNDVIIQAGAVIGAPGFGFNRDSEGELRSIVQVGCVVIEDSVQIGSNTCIDCATFGETRVGRNTKVDNHVNIGHNARIGENCLIVAQVGIAGSATIGDNCNILGQAAVRGHINLPAGSTLLARSVLTKTMTEPGVFGGFPAVDHRLWKKAHASTMRSIRKK